MPKKQRIIPAASKAVATPTPIAFPDIAHKQCLDVTVLVEDQILLIDNVLNPEECKRFVELVDRLPLELTPPKKRGEADRVNYRVSVTSTEFAARLHEVFLPHLPGFCAPIASRRANVDTGRIPVAMNSNIRMYKYEIGQYFGAHYDDSIRDRETGAKSEWTLLIYLTGEEDGVKGGETLFYRDQRGSPRETITPPLRRGMALLHRHGAECMLHEGSPVLAGKKYVLRSDLLFA